MKLLLFAAIGSAVPVLVDSSNSSAQYYNIMVHADTMPKAVQILNENGFAIQTTGGAANGVQDKSFQNVWEGYVSPVLLTIGSVAGSIIGSIL